MTSSPAPMSQARSTSSSASRPLPRPTQCFGTAEGGVLVLEGLDFLAEHEPAGLHHARVGGIELRLELGVDRLHVEEGDHVPLAASASRLKDLVVAQVLALVVQGRRDDQDDGLRLEVGQLVPDHRPDMQRPPRIVEDHRLLHLAVVEMELAGAVHHQGDEVRFAMAVPAAPLVGRDVVQPEETPHRETELMVEFQEVELAALVAPSGNGEPSAVRYLEMGKGHVGHGRACPSVSMSGALRHCM